MSTLGCGKHRAFVMERGGTNLVGEMTPLMRVRWERVRDEISTANVRVGVSECCALLGDLEAGRMELHIHREGDSVWQGVITRLEYEISHVDIFAEDMLWVAKRTALSQGYDQSYPNIWSVVDRMTWLMEDMTYAKYGDPWNMLPHLHPVVGPDDPETSKKQVPWALSTWEDFDLYAEDHGTDYTVVNRDIYWSDIGYAWAVLPKLEAEHLSEWPRIVEYGNELATRVIISNNEGYAGLGVAPAGMRDHYGYVDHIINQEREAGALDDEPDAPPTPEELESMRQSAQRQVANRYPTPTSIVVPANSTLMPSSPWRVNDLIPGAWFDVEVTNLCRSMVETQRLHQVTVTETPDNGEKVEIVTVSAPSQRIDVTP